jgi:uncharacterized protein (DUF362 family)
MSQLNKPNGNSIVSLIRSSKQYASQIDEAEIRHMVHEAVRLAGGLSDIVKDGQTVVVKPNVVVTRHVSGNIKPLLMLVSDPFKESVQIPELMNGVTTDRRVTKAVVELVRELNPSGKVYIMECAGDGKTSENLKRMGYNHENIPGVDEFIAIGENGDYRDVEAEDLVAVEVKNQQCKKLPKFLKNKYYFDKIYYSADVIISLCCLKNHANTAMTGGIKNVGLGARPAKIYSPKGKTVSAFVINHAWEPINDFIHDYYAAKPVDFVLTDGLEGSQYGNACQGAPSYEEAKMNMRLILASKDAVAADSIHSCIIGIDPEKVKHLKDLARDGFGEIDSSKITVVGNVRVDEVKKPFSFARGILGKIFKEPPKKRYSDYEAPEVKIEDISIKDNRIEAKLTTATKTNKVELFIDGKLVETFTEGFDQLQYPLNGEISEGSHEITFYAYDRFLNCGYKTTTFAKSELKNSS